MELTEAHLRALWQRSCFPLEEDRMLVFGIRGALPVDFAGTGFAPSQPIGVVPLNYQTMCCTVGQWRPGRGFALFPGSTVPFLAAVRGALARGGAGVNQLGLGRYARYTPGWHKRKEGPRGHWALRQDCPITLQRTSDDEDYDLEDRWEVGRIAGDNIHCAFHMGLADRIPESRFSSEGCQVVAGTVRKGEPDSERGPWRKFIEPFLPGGSAPTHVEYVLFSGHELQQMIVGRYRGKTVILRFGSKGPLVEELQAKLGIAIDGDFGPRTFRAVLDFQTSKFGPNADDGIVGAETAAALGLTLPAFDFERAVTQTPATGSTPARARSAPHASPKAIAWGAVTDKKHGPAFKAEVVSIAGRLSCDPSHLMAVMAFESGESFAPDKRNAAGSGATGLIQFMPSTARRLNTTTAQLAAMTALQQLEFVEKHLGSVAGSRPLRTLGDVYMAVLWPAAIGLSDSHALFKKPSRAYEQNKGLDAPPKDGVITKAEATARVFAKLQKGMQVGRIG